MSGAGGSSRARPAGADTPGVGVDPGRCDAHTARRDDRIVVREAGIDPEPQ
jgi:hypothetical protein